MKKMDISVICLLLTISLTLFGCSQNQAGTNSTYNEISESVSGENPEVQSEKAEEPDAEQRDALPKNVLSEKYELKKEDSGYYVIENRDSGKLLSVRVSEPEMTEEVEQFVAAVASVYQIAHDENYTYGDSKTLPPCEDHLISCDRMIARALWNLGYTDQNTGGMTIGNEDEYLTSHGFRKLSNTESFQRGDIILYERTENGAVSHTCVLTGYNQKTGICSRYDCGGTPDNPRFARIEPIVEPVVYQYDYGKRIRAVYRMEGAAGTCDSSLFPDELEDVNELSQRWIVEMAGSDAFIVRSAIDDSLCITEKNGKLTIER